MSDSCPLWRPDCPVRGVWGAANDVAGGVGKAADMGASALGAVGDVTGGLNRVTSPVGGLMGAIPLVLIGLLLWMVWRMFSTGVRTARVAVPAAVKGYTGIDLDVVKKPAKSGEKAGKDLRVRRESRRGVSLGVHTGTSATVVDRQNDSTGKPSRVVVCASGPGEAELAIGSRMVGHAWRTTGSKPCDLGKAQQHFTFATRSKKGK